jgi:hypothetical protein
MAIRFERVSRAATLGRLGDYFLGATMVRLKDKDVRAVSRGICICYNVGQEALAGQQGAPRTVSAVLIRNDEHRSFLQVVDVALCLGADETLEIPVNEVTERVRSGDSVFVLRQSSGKMLIVFAAFGSTLENQLCWLFDLPREFLGGFVAADATSFAQKGVGIPESIVLANLGLVPDPV